MYITVTRVVGLVKVAKSASLGYNFSTTVPDSI